MSSDDDVRDGPYVGALLRLAWQHIRQELHAAVVAAGYDDLNPSHLAVFRYPSIDGLRPTAIAEDMEIGKQSVNDLLGHLEGRGYIRREPDPTDGRARVVRLTPTGRRLERTVNQQARTVESRVAARLGAKKLDQLRATLQDLADLPAPP